MKLLKKAMLERITKCEAKQAYCRFHYHSTCLVKFRDCEYWKRKEVKK